MNEIIDKALKNGRFTLSEYESKIIVKSAGVITTREYIARSKDEAVSFAQTLGFPIVLKGLSDTITHKTDMGLVKLNLNNNDDVGNAYDAIMNSGLDIDMVLVQEMIKGDREFVIGLTRDPHFGPSVMFGLGGIYTEVMNDVSFRIAPLSHIDAEEMIEEIKTKKLLHGFRGSEPVDKEALIESLIGIGNLGIEHEEIVEIDINPLIISGNKPVAVDALVILGNCE